MDGYMGEIRMFGGNYAPRDWALCDGRLLDIESHSALFSIIGTIYGGDGRTNFALPNLKGRTAIGAGTGQGLTTRILGQMMGFETELLTQQEMPTHSHTADLDLASMDISATLKGNTGTATTTNPTDGAFGTARSNTYNTASPDTPMHTGSIETQVSGAGSVTVHNAGNSHAHNNMQPSQVVNYIICINGMYPSRS